MIAKIIRREWKRIASQPTHFVLLLIMPPLLFFFFAFIYQQHHARNLSIAVWDQDNSALSLQLSYLLEETPSIHIEMQVNDQEAIEKAIQSGKIWGAIHFPRDMEKNLKSNHPANVTLFTNSAAIVPAKLIYKDAARVIIMASSGAVLKKLVKQGTPKEKAMALVQPIKLTTHPLYNPSYNYQQYLAPGLITVALQMIIIMVSVLLINKEWKTKSMDDLIHLADGSAWKIIVGKTFAHLVVAWFNFLLIVWIIFPFFGLYHPGTTFAFFVLYTFLCLACIGLGLLVSSIFKDTMLASDIALFYTSPAFVFSGYTFPRWAMPWYDQFYAHLMPFTPFLDGFFKVYYMELPLSYISDDLAILSIFIVLSFPLAILIFQRTINKRQHALIS